MINQNDLSAVWRERGAKGEPQFATLPNIKSEQTFGKTLAEPKAIKSLSTRHNIRDYMTGLELTLSTLDLRFYHQFAAFMKTMLKVNQQVLLCHLNFPLKER